MVTKLLSKSGFIAYYMSKDVLEERLGIECKCKKCGAQVLKIWLVASTCDFFCNTCFDVWEEKFKFDAKNKETEKYKLRDFDKLLGL